MAVWKIPRQAKVTALNSNSDEKHMSAGIMGSGDSRLELHIIHYTS